MIVTNATAHHVPQMSAFLIRLTELGSGPINRLDAESLL